MASFIVPLSADKASAAIDLVVTLLGVVLSLIVVAIILRAKQAKLARTGCVQITPNDFTSGVGHFYVIAAYRYVSVRGVACGTLAIILSLLSGTALLGTEATRCVTSGRGYAGLTKIERTTCYKARPVPGSLNMLAVAGGRLRELVTSETEVDVRSHPLNYDYEKDEITQFSELNIKMRGVVTNLNACESNITLIRKSGGSIEVGVSDTDISGAKSEPPEGAANPAVHVDYTDFGFTFGKERDLTIAMYGKEVTRNDVTTVYLVYGGVREGEESGVAACTELKFSVAGLQVIPFVRYAMALGDEDVDPKRLTEVAWMAASLSQIGLRQEACDREIYTIKECTRVSSNTSITMGVLGGAIILAFLVYVGMIWSLRRSGLNRVITPFEMLASAAAETDGDERYVARKAKRVYCMLKLVPGGGQLTWSRTRGDGAPESMLGKIRA